jgi:hypothetical protein
MNEKYLQKCYRYILIGALNTNKSIIKLKDNNQNDIKNAFI